MPIRTFAEQQSGESQCRGSESVQGTLPRAGGAPICRKSPNPMGGSPVDPCEKALFINLCTMSYEVKERNSKTERFVVTLLQKFGVAVCAMAEDSCCIAFPLCSCVRSVHQN